MKTPNTKVAAAAAKPPVVLTDAIVDEIAEVTGRDRRTVMRRMLGLPVKGRAGTIVDAAIDARGLRRVAS